MKRLILLSLISMLLMPTIVKADTGDDTLRFYLSKSDLVVLGKISTEPEGIIKEIGVPNYRCEFIIEDVMKGADDLKGKTININIERCEMHERDKHPLIKKDSECILFLNKILSENSWWVTADFWFGVQYPSPWMAKSLKRLTEEK